MIRVAIACMLSIIAGVAHSASGGNENLDSVFIDLRDTGSLQRGAAAFTNYCLSCHSIKYMRYNRMAEDLGISDEVLRTNFLQTSQQLGSKMTVNMADDDAKRWFGTAPPDLSLIARSKSPAWIYTFLRGFYVDDESHTGWNNHLFADTAMPHVLYEVQGSTTREAYDSFVRDMTNFMVYVAEPAKLVRYEIGIWVLIFVALFTVLAYYLKKEYWKDIH